jgi:hypothetical protein
MDSRSFAKIFFSMTVGKRASLCETPVFATPEMAGSWPVRSVGVGRLLAGASHRVRARASLPAYGGTKGGQGLPAFGGAGGDQGSRPTLAFTENKLPHGRRPTPRLTFR